MNRKSEKVKEKQISEVMASIENRVRHAYNQGYEQGLEAGREQTMTREQALKLLADARYADDLQGNNDLQTAHNMAIEALEQEPRWIPVNERLPEDIKPVIVTWKNTDPKSYYQYIVGKHFIGTAHYKNDKWFWYSSVTEDLLAEYGRCDCEEFDEAIDVIAWMPLPAPFEPQESEGKK